MQELKKLLCGKDIRIDDESDMSYAAVQNISDFDTLVPQMFGSDRMAAMRAAGTVEKITVKNPLLLAKYKQKILAFAPKAVNREIKWHMAQLIPRLCLNISELQFAWDLLVKWAADKTNSNSVRVNAIQGLNNLVKLNPAYTGIFIHLLAEIEKQNVPSVCARIRHIKQQYL
jgi:hypothetical protein